MEASTCSLCFSVSLCLLNKYPICKRKKLPLVPVLNVSGSMVMVQAQSRISSRTLMKKVQNFEQCEPQVLRDMCFSSKQSTNGLNKVRNNHIKAVTECAQTAKTLVKYQEVNPQSQKVSATRSINLSILPALSLKCTLCLHCQGSLTCPSQSSRLMLTSKARAKLKSRPGPRLK